MEDHRPRRLWGARPMGGCATVHRTPLTRFALSVARLAGGALLWLLLVGGDVRGQTPDVQSTLGVSVSIELSPGRHVPWDQALTGTVTLGGLDHSSYSSVVLRADVAGHEHRTSTCFGDDTGKDIEVEVDASRESREVEVFKPCNHAEGGFGTYDYVLDLSVSRADPVSPGDRVELASARVHFLVTRYLEDGDTWLPAPEPEAAAWMDPDPRTVDMVVHGEWTQFRFRSNVLLYTEDHLSVEADGSSVAGHFATQRPDLPPEQACMADDRVELSWRRAIHQDLWIVACRPGKATIHLRHENNAVAPLYSYTITTLASPRANDAPQFPEAETGVRRVAENAPAGTSIGLPVAAVDADGDTLTYTLEGDDAGSFEIVASSGQLLTKAALDFENRSSYSVVVIASDPSPNSDSVDVTIRVSNIDEDGTLRLSPAQPQVRAALMAALTDPDGDISDITWVWERSDGGRWTVLDGAVSGAESSAYTPKDSDAGRLLRVTASYTDGQGTGKRAQAATDYPVPDPAPGPNPGGGGGGGGGGPGGGGGSGGPAAVVEIDGASYAAADTEAVFTAAVSDGTRISALRWTVIGNGGFTATSNAQRFVFAAPAGGAYTVSVTVDDIARRTLAGSVTLTVFGDITGHQFVDEIVWLAEEGITRGCAAHSYCPSNPVTRAQMASFLARALNLEPLYLVEWLWRGSVGAGCSPRRVGL